MVWIALSQPGRELGEVTRADILDIDQARLGTELQVTPEIAVIGTQRVGRQATFHRKVIEIARHCTGQRMVGSRIVDHAKTVGEWQEMKAIDTDTALE